jgi:hypothetical protein
MKLEIAGPILTAKDLETRVQELRKHLREQQETVLFMGDLSHKLTKLRLDIICSELCLVQGKLQAIAQLLGDIEE